MASLAGSFAVLAACALVVLLSGVRLSRYGDIIAEKTGVGGTWMGVVAMASVTSLPELVNGASAILVFDLPDIAAGDIFGSCMFNLVILACLDARHPTPLTARLHQGHVLSAAYGMLLAGMAAMAMIAGPRAWSIGWVGLHSLAFMGIYLVALRSVFVFERTRIAQLAEEMTGDIRYGTFTLRSAVLRYMAAAAVLVTAAAYLPAAGEAVARASGLEASFVGNIFIAISTSLPEVVVSIAAARIGALDMAVGNLFGSNLFNIAVLGFDDVLYTRGSLLADVSPVHLVALAATLTMASIAVIGLTYRASRKRYRLSWDALGMLAVYAVAVTLLYVLD
jgi:cation:H+ antiporter